MTMLHIETSFKASLSITHPEKNLIEVSAVTGLTPRWLTTAGAPRTTPKGDLLEGTFPQSIWWHQFDVEGVAELGLILEDLVESLQPHRTFFRRIVSEGARIELFCGVFAMGNWDEIISYSLMARFADLCIDLRLDVYPKKEALEVGIQAHSENVSTSVAE